MVVALYGEHYRSLVLLASLLVRDVATAEEVVQDSFIALYGRVRRLRDTEFVYWDTGTAHLLPRLLRLPDGTSRASGPLWSWASVAVR